MGDGMKTDDSLTSNPRMTYSKPMALEIGFVENCTLGALKMREGIDEVQLPRDCRIDVADIHECAPRQTDP